MDNFFGLNGNGVDFVVTVAFLIIKGIHENVLEDGIVDFNCVLTGQAGPFRFEKVVNFCMKNGSVVV